MTHYYLLGRRRWYRGGVVSISTILRSNACFLAKFSDNSPISKRTAELEPADFCLCDSY